MPTAVEIITADEDICRIESDDLDGEFFTVLIYTPTGHEGLLASELGENEAIQLAGEVSALVREWTGYASSVARGEAALARIEAHNASN